MHVLHEARPRVRRHLGGVLRIAAPAPDGRWIVVALIEEEDDHYLLVAVRYLDDAETEAARKMIGGES